MKTKLKFTFETGKSVPFLDTKISIGSDGKLKTDLYTKTTDAHLYLRQESCHPKSCTRGLVKGELLRVRRICSEDADFLKRAAELKNYFLKRGFNGALIDKTIEEVRKNKREEVLKYKEKVRSDRVPFVIQFHPRLRALGKILHKHFHLLKLNERLKKAFPEPSMVAFKRLPNLADQLIHTNSERKQNVEESKKCGVPRCQCCIHFQETNTIEINGRKHFNKNGGSCRSENIIYTLRCKKCNKFYIGESQNRLHQRLNGHRDSVKKVRRGLNLNEEYTDTGAAIHFAKDDHNFQRDLEAFILERGQWETAGERKERESFWICYFKTHGEGGLNKTAGIFASLYSKN